MTERAEHDVVARLRSAGCVFAEEEARVLVEEAGTAADLAAMVARRVAGAPLEHVLGWAMFCGSRILVEPGVFVPRPRTGYLVELTIAVAARLTRPVVVELCCGSGAVAVVLEAALDGAELYAADVDAVAVRCARRNLPDSVGVFEGDLDEPLPTGLRGRVDVLVANAPYVPTDAIATLPAEARLHEPLVALDGGIDGLDVHRRLAAAAMRLLRRGGTVLVETSRPQADRTATIFAQHGLTVDVRRSAHHDATVMIGRRIGRAADSR